MLIKIPWFLLGNSDWLSIIEILPSVLMIRNLSERNECESVYGSLMRQADHAR